MYCQANCKLCPHLIISTAVTFNATTNTLNITIPNNNYRCGDIVCIVVAQTIPTTTTINALVNIAVGTTSFPLVKCNCVQATACEISTRTKYKTKVIVNNSTGSFRLLGNICKTKNNCFTALPVTTTTPATTNIVEGGSEQ